MYRLNWRFIIYGVYIKGKIISGWFIVRNFYLNFICENDDF